jgi:nickel/cobalt transporter (NicO) family protein
MCIHADFNFMRKKRFIVPALICIFLFTNTSTVQAHPADLYAQTVNVTITQTGLQIKWEIKPGPLLINFLWHEIDSDQDGILSPLETETWGNARAALITATLDDKPFPLLMDSVQLPADLRSFQAGEEYITFHLSAAWGPETNNVRRLVLENGLEQTKSINWFYLTATENTAFLFPTQSNHIINIDIIQDRNLMSDQTDLLTAWDSGTPALPFGQGKDVVTETAEQVVPELAERSPQEILLDLVRRKEFSVSFYIFALVIALALGALHALTPGHGKTVVAAYLVGSRGTTFHAIALGTIVTLTHTGSVFLLGIITLAASQYILPTTIIPFLEILSGLLIVGLGFYLLWLRFLYWRKANPIAVPGGDGEPGRKFSLAPASTGKKISNSYKIQTLPVNSHHHGDGKAHSHEVPEAITWRSLIALGISGGLVPCPDAIAILLVAIAINRILLGLSLIISFSLGLAVVLIVIGLLMVNSRRIFDRAGFLDRLAPVMPIVSAVIVLALGFGLTWGAYVRAKGDVNFAVPVQRSINEARVLYLKEDENRFKQLLLTDYKKDTSQVITQPTHSVIDYAVSPDQTRVVYIVQTNNLENEIWLIDLASMDDKKMSDCADAICSGMVWSPDGNRVIFEHMSLDSDASGFPTLWWININTGEEQPVFQESQLPGGNPRWSPNGEWLSYAAPEGIRLYHLKDGESRVIKNILGAAALWSPDSRSILLRDVVIRNNQFVTQLFLYDIESEALVNLNPNDGVENILAAWSPAGEYIAVVRRDLAIPRGDQIWLMRADGSDARAITNTPDVLHSSLNWSPDGKYLMYDLYFLDAFPFASRLQAIEIESGEVTDLGIKGFNPQWVWK